MRQINWCIHLGKILSAKDLVTIRSITYQIQRIFGLRNKEVNTSEKRLEIGLEHSSLSLEMFYLVFFFFFSPCFASHKKCCFRKRSVCICISGSQSHQDSICTVCWMTSFLEGHRDVTYGGVANNYCRPLGVCRHHPQEIREKLSYEAVSLPVKRPLNSLTHPTLNFYQFPCRHVQRESGLIMSFTYVDSDLGEKLLSPYIQTQYHGPIFRRDWWLGPGQRIDLKNPQPLDKD